MKIGLCLCGGGAKGAYQAGVIKGLRDRGINKFDVISGTSVGAINGYYIFTDNVEKMEEMWTNIEHNSEICTKIIENTVDNSQAIDKLNILTNNKKDDIDFYVNYIEIKDRVPVEKIVNLSELSYDEGINSIKYSSLLPCNPKGNSDMMNQFEKDLQEGLYDGYKLDGALMNNTLINPLIENDVDKIIVISMKHDYKLPEYIENITKNKEIIVVRPETLFKKGDTLRFERQFCSSLYNEGIRIGKSIEI